VTRGQLPQKAGSLGLDGGGAATAVPPRFNIEKIPDNQMTAFNVQLLT